MELQTGIFAELLRGELERLSAERRSSLENPQTPLSYPAEWLLDIWNGGRTDSGIRVSELTAFQATAFLACVDFIAGAIAALPKHVFERRILANGRASHRIAWDHGYEEMVHLEPNEEMSRFVAEKALLAHILAWGNGYQEIQRDAGNQAVALWPRNPYKTKPHRVLQRTVLPAVAWRPFPVVLQAGELCFRTTDGIDDIDYSDQDASNGDARLIPAADMIHVPGLAFDGRVGQDVVWLARQTIGVALATEKFGAKYFANYARPGGILEAPALSPEAREQAKRSWMEAQGGENSHRVAVLPPGYKFTAISNDPDKSQMTESQEASGVRICSIFHLPPRLLGLQKTTSRSNTEQEAQEVISYALRPWTEALKLEYKRKLFPSPGVGRAAKNRYFVDYDYSDLLRADATAREAFYASGRQWGYLNANDVRAFEKLNPIEEEWAEDYWMPINMTLAETPLDPSHQDGKGAGTGAGKGGGGEDDEDDEDDPAGGDSEDERVRRAYGRLFRDAFGRVLTREKRDARAIQAAFGAVLLALRDVYFAAARAQMRLTAAAGAESERFCAEYLRGMEKRAAAWTAESAETELARAMQAMRLAAYREAAAMKAKQAAAKGAESE